MTALFIREPLQALYSIQTRRIPMSDLNSVNLIGRLTKTAEVKYTANNIPICCFSIATNRIRSFNETKKTRVYYFNFRLLGDRWEGITPYLIKGKLVAIQGHLEQDRWEKDGKQRSCIKIAVDDLQPLEFDALEDSENLPPAPEHILADTVNERIEGSPGTTEGGNEEAGGTF
jgi:single-strand DNA-binding protein